MRKSSVSLLDGLIYLAVIIFTCMVVSSYDFSRTNETVVALFIIIGIISFINIVVCRANCNIFRMVYMFSYIFFFVAPLYQYTTRIIFWSGNRMRIYYSDADYIKANIFIILFLLIFDVGYIVWGKKSRDRTRRMKEKMQITDNALDWLVVFSSTAFLVLLVTGNVSGVRPFISNANIFSQIINILRYIPVCALLIYLSYYKEANGKRRKLLLGVIAAETAVIYLPTWGHLARFMLFGTYLVIYTTLFHDSRRRGPFFLVWVLAMCYMFSLSKHMTSLRAWIPPKMDFNHVDFDAYQILMATIKYVDKEGIEWGKNILSAAAFLIPRDMWHGKLESTGALIMRYYGSWFENVSSPLVGEMYFAFKTVGVVVLSFLVGLGARIVDGWSNENSFTKHGIFVILTGMTIYIMRGALLPTTAFTGGFILAMLVMGYICRKKDNK